MIIEQCKQTKLEKYNDPNWNNREKAFKTCIKRLGVKIPSQNRDVMLKSNLKYIYNNIIFASSWELAFYIWLKDNKINFQYQPDFNFYYFDEYQNKIRKYFPDFYLVDSNEIIEIKGDNHFDKNGYQQDQFIEDIDDEDDFNEDYYDYYDEIEEEEEEDDEDSEEEESEVNDYSNDYSYNDDYGDNYDDYDDY